MGAMAESNVAIIAQQITAPFSEKEQKARAIFYWITHNIAIDPKGTKGNDQKNTDPVNVIQLRKATPLGFSLLVQEMCSQANIRCLSVDGFTKTSVDDIGNKADEINHSWNVIQLGQSPDSWFYIDAAKGSGYLDKKMTVFTPSFSSNYFFTDKETFNQDHYPDNESWRLGPGPKGLSEFYGMPVYYNYANGLGIKRTDPKSGVIKTKPTTTVKFIFTHDTEKPIEKLEMVIGEDKRAGKPENIEFEDNGRVLKFSCQFKRADEYPVNFFADGKPIVGFLVISEE